MLFKVEKMQFTNNFTLNINNPYQSSYQQPKGSLNVYTHMNPPVINRKSNTNEADCVVGMNLDEVYIEEENENYEECYNPLISNYLNNIIYIQSRPEISSEVFIYIYIYI